MVCVLNACREGYLILLHFKELPSQWTSEFMYIMVKSQYVYNVVLRMTYLRFKKDIPTALAQ
jgi:hypothetical protein